MDLIQQELERIRKANGGVLVPEHVVEAARSEDSPLHSRFTWDDSEAAHQYRLVQARALIRVRVFTEPQTASTVRAYVSLKRDRYNGESGGYREIRQVLKVKELREELLAEAMEDMKAFEAKYHALNELAPVFEAMKSVASRKIGKQPVMATAV